MEEGKLKLSGFKVEITVRPNGIATSFSKHYPGSVSDLPIFSERVGKHRIRLKKKDEDDCFIDD